MNSLKSVVNWFRGQSDFSHTLMSAAATGAVSAVVTGLDQTHSTLVTLASSSVMLGTQCWVALVAGPTMFINMERHAFGNIQARLFPKMGMVCMSMSGLAMAGYLNTHSPDTPFTLLTSSLLINALNSFIIFPITTDYMYERRKHEVGTEEFKTANKMFGITHGISNLINLGSIAANVAFFYIIATRVAKTL